MNISKRKCLTPEAIFSMHVQSDHADGCARVIVEVKLPPNISLSEQDAIQIEQDSHDFMEQVLARYF